MSRARGSGQADLRHPENTVYRCFLPDLTGFTGHRRAGPDPQHHLRADSGPKTRTSGEEFSLARADCEYRAPLSPRLARPEFMVGEAHGGCQRKVGSVHCGESRNPLLAGGLFEGLPRQRESCIRLAISTATYPAHRSPSEAKAPIRQESPERAQPSLVGGLGVPPNLYPLRFPPGKWAASGAGTGAWPCAPTNTEQERR